MLIFEALAKIAKLLCCVSSLPLHSFLLAQLYWQFYNEYFLTTLVLSTRSISWQYFALVLFKVLSKVTHTQ